MEEKNIWTGSIRLSNLLYPYNSAIYGNLANGTDFIDLLSLNTELFQLFIEDSAWEGSWLNDIICDGLSMFCYKEGGYLKLIVFEVVRYAIVVIESIVLIFNWDFGIDILVEVVEDLYKILIFG